MSRASRSPQRAADRHPAPPADRPAPGTSRTATWWPIIATQLVGALFVVATVAASRSFDEPVATFTRDVQDLAGIAWYSGAVSTLTIITWAAVATLALVATWLATADRRRMGLFAVLAVALAVDDAFLVHEAVGPENGVPQEFFLGSYALLAAVLAVLFLGAPRTGSSFAFFLGLVWLGLSALADGALQHRFLLEDGSKLLGALTWLAVPLIALGRPARRE